MVTLRAPIFFGDLQGLAQVVEIGLLVAGIDKGIVGVAVEAADADARLFGPVEDFARVLVGPTPKFDIVEPCLFGRLETLGKGDFGKQRFDAGGFLESHCCNSFLDPEKGIW